MTMNPTRNEPLHKSMNEPLANPANAASPLTRRRLLKAGLAASAAGLWSASSVSFSASAASAAPAAQPGQPKLDGDFPSGCCVFEGLKDGALVCRPSAPPSATGGLWYWFTARLSGARGRQAIELHWPGDNAAAQAKSEYGGNQNFATVLDRAINVSPDLRRWTPVEGVKLSGQTARFTVDAGEGSAPLYIAVGLPYFAHDLESLLADCRASALAQVTEIARTGNGQPVHAVRIGPKGRGEGAFYLQGYQHGTEWSGARILTAMIRHLLSDAGGALRERFVFHIVPAMNVGHLYGKGVSGNMNRDWETFRMAETVGARDHIRRIAQGGDRILHALDLHNGWASRSGSGACLTAARPGEAPAPLIRRQEAFAHHAFARCDWTQERIWRPQHPGGVTMADWFVKELGVAAQTAEFSRHMIWERARADWAPVTPSAEERLAVQLAEALGSFDWGKA